MPAKFIARRFGTTIRSPWTDVHIMFVYCIHAYMHIQINLVKQNVITSACNLYIVYKIVIYTIVFACSYITITITK
jgi:hypothetical protein